MNMKSLLQKHQIQQVPQHLQQQTSYNHKRLKHSFITFRQCIEQVGRDGRYQHNMFILMTVFWISASLFLAFPFYLFPKPHYFITQKEICLEYQETCIQKVCNMFFPDNIIHHVIGQVDLTTKFQLFCDLQWKRVFYKSATTILACIGLIFYGLVGDKKGRKIAMKISWRFYTIGVILFCTTQTQFLMIFGYFIACVNCFPSLILQFILMFETTNNQMRLRSFLIILSSGFMGSLFTALFTQSLLAQLGVRLTIFLICGLPALILCFFLDYIEQSSTYLYKDDKIKAFNSINRIARKNRKPIILIDLGSSEWIRLQSYTVNLAQAFKMQKIKTNICLLFFFLFVTTFSSKSVQVSLDSYTDSHLRGFLMNGSTALAYFTLILTKLKVKIPLLFLLLLILNLSYLIIIQQAVTSQVSFLAIVNLVVLRYFSQMIYGNLLVISIEHCPTIIRGQMLGLILTSISLSEVLVRLLQDYKWTYVLINIIGVILVLLIQIKKKFVFQNGGKMTDTIKGFYYDQEDKFVRVNRQ